MKIAFHILIINKKKLHVYKDLILSVNYGEDDEAESNFVDHERLALMSKLFNEKQMNRYAKFKESSLENRKKIRSTQKIEFPRIKKVDFNPHNLILDSSKCFRGKYTN